jgi:hypothetical protein
MNSKTVSKLNDILKIISNTVDCVESGSIDVSIKMNKKGISDYSLSITRYDFTISDSVKLAIAEKIKGIDGDIELAIDSKTMIVKARIKERIV